jgi:hypothetical protein
MITVTNIQDIPSTGYMVYILYFNGAPIVLGHGTKNRAKVIFDDVINCTWNHIKSSIVRLHHLFDNGTYERKIIPCQSKSEASILEKKLHKELGGNRLAIPNDIRRSLFSNLQPGSTVELILNLALESSFSALADLRNWRKKGLIPEPDWAQISERLRLNEVQGF